MLPIYEYDGTLAGNLLENTDVINTLTSSDNTKPLSAAQGKALNNKINNVQAMFGTPIKLYYVSTVVQVSGGSVTATVYTQDELKEMLGITQDNGFSNRITVAVINGARNTQAAAVVACNYEEKNKALRIKCEEAQSGSLRVNLLIAFNVGIEG